MIAASICRCRRSINRCLLQGKFCCLTQRRSLLRTGTFFLTYISHIASNLIAHTAAGHASFFMTAIRSFK